MRDKHLNEYHQEQKSPQDLDVLQPDPDDIQPLLFDLVQAANVDAVKPLLPFFKAFKKTIREELQIIAAASGSSSLLDLLMSASKPDGDTLKKLANSAIKSKNIETVECFLKIKSFWLFTGILSEVLRSDSMEIYNLWESFVDDRFESQVNFLSGRYKRKTIRQRAQIAGRFTAPASLSAIADHSHREQLVLRLWKNKGIIAALDDGGLGQALSNVAQSCYSVRIAKCLIEAGAKVDYRRGSKYPTPLRHATRNDSASAAELMRFLLRCGADPEIDCEPGKKGKPAKIRDEKGAKGIAKWLGLSWDELIMQTKEEREEREATAEQDAHTKENEEEHEK